MFGLVREQVNTASKLEFESLMRDSYRHSYNLAYRLTGNATEAEDLLQDAYLRAYRFFHRYNEDMSFQRWMYRIISNAHVDRIRRQTTFELPDSKLRPDEEISHRGFSDVVQQGLNEMNPEFRLAVILADIEGFTYEEVAEVMETTVGTVRSRIHRGRVQLRTYLTRTAPGQYRQFQKPKKSGSMESEL
jgi:RNA polymerase sigma-70 factor (ECF subfamily)